MSGTQKPAATPFAFLVVGPAGSGKSSVARELARRADASYLDKDTIAGPFVELILRERGDNPWERDENEYYQQALLPVEYDTVFRVAADNLQLGRSVVIDAPFRRYTGDRGYLDAARQRSGWPPAHAVVVHVTVSKDTHRARLVSRGNDRDRWKLDNWDEFWERTRADVCAWDGALHVRVDNDADEADFAEITALLAD